VRQAGMANDAVITVVDAANFDTHLAASPVNRRQIEAADFLVISKIDLVGGRALDAVEKRLGRVNRRALRMRAEAGRVPSDLLLGTSAARIRREYSADASRCPPSAHLHEDRIGAFVVREERPLDVQQFQRFLEDLPRTVYRAKGFARVAGNDWSCLFNFTCGRYELNWIKLGEAAGPTQAVFIGRDVEKYRARIERRLARCLAD